jgi:hypothetical protein
MRSVLFLTHENLDKTAVSKAMFEDVARNLQSENVSVTLFSASEKAEKYKKNGINYCTFRRKSYGRVSFSAISSLVSSYMTFFRLLVKNDIFFYRSYPTLLMFGWLSWLCGKKNIFDTRGLFFEELFDSGKLNGRGLHFTFRQIEKILLKISHRIIAVTNEQAEYYKEILPSCKDKLLVNPNGAPHKAIISSKINSTKLELVYVGSLVKWHSPDMVKEVCEHLSKLGVDYHLTVFTKDLNKAHEVFSVLNNKVTIKSHDYRNKPIRFHYGFCFISGGISKDICFPVKFLEYVQSGTKVIGSSNVKVVSYLINKFNFGFSVPIETPANVIAAQLKDDSKNNKNRIISIPEELTFENQSNNIKTLIENI